MKGSENSQLSPSLNRNEVVETAPDCEFTVLERSGAFNHCSCSCHFMSFAPFMLFMFPALQKPSFRGIPTRRVARPRPPRRAEREPQGNTRFLRESRITS